MLFNAVCCDVALLLVRCAGVVLVRWLGVLLLYCDVGMLLGCFGCCRCVNVSFLLFDCLLLCALMCRCVVVLLGCCFVLLLQFAVVLAALSVCCFLGLLL